MQANLRLMLLLLPVVCMAAAACSSNSRKDAGEEDSGVEINDATTHMDAHVVNNDAGVSIDSGVSDSGVAPSDSGVAPSDSGVAPSDSGVAMDAGSIQRDHCDPAMTIDNAGALANFPRFAANKQGVIAAAWNQTDTLQATPVPTVAVYSGGVWGAPHVLGQNVYQTPKMAIDGQGNVHAYWSDAANNFLRADYDAAQHSWTPSTSLVSSNGDLTGNINELAVSSGGMALQGLGFFDSGGRRTASAAIWDPVGKTWGPLSHLQVQSSTSSPYLPVSGLNAAGIGGAVWTSSDMNMTVTTLHARAYTPGGGFATMDVTAPLMNIVNYSYDLAATGLPNGDLMVLSAGGNGGLHNVGAQIFSAAGQWGAPQMFTSNSPVEPSIIGDDDGNLTAAWTDGGMLSAARYINGAWSGAAMLGMGSGAQMAIDGAGNVSVVFASQGSVTLRRVPKLGTTWTDPVDPTMGDTGQVQARFGVGHDASNNPIVMYQVFMPNPMGAGNVAHIHARVCH